MAAFLLSYPGTCLRFVFGAKHNFRPPFEPLHATELKALSFKMALLIALVCGKSVGDLHALASDTICIEFGKGDCIVRLTPRCGYMPKVFTTPFRAQVIMQQVFVQETVGLE